ETKKGISFYNNKGRLSYTCKKCQYSLNSTWLKKHKLKRKRWDRNYRLQKEYGITTNQFNKILLKQNGKCRIRRSNSPGRGHENFNVDHKHGTKVVRGLLCFDCNTGIGKLKDSPVLIRRALRYLERN